MLCQWVQEVQLSTYTKTNILLEITERLKGYYLSFDENRLLYSIILEAEQKTEITTDISKEYHGETFSNL